MKVSVVMTTYNGQAFILEQLDSILEQTRQPDEVLIFDDCSTDRTPEIIRDYIGKNNLETWKLTVNEQNLGWKRNFAEALQKASGDIVFPADQDDRWRPCKIEEMTAIMEEDENIGLLVGNSRNFYTGSGTQGIHPFYSLKTHTFYVDRIWNNVGLISRVNRILKEDKLDTGLVKQIPFDTGLLTSQRQGCVMAVRREMLLQALQYWDEDCPHDTVLWFYAAARDALYLYEKYVIDYRHHSQNTGFTNGMGKGLSASREREKIRLTKRKIRHLLPILDESTVKDSRQKKAVLKKILRYYDLRDRFLREKRLRDGISVIRCRGNVGRRQVVFDWLLTYLT